jgi:mannose-6-phosphate isomerase
MGRDGTPRALHVDEALEVIHFGEQGESLVAPSTLSDAPILHQRLVANDKFTFDRYQTGEPFGIRPAQRESFVIITCTEGRAAVVFGSGARGIRYGETLLLPACLDVVTIEPEGGVELLAMSLPMSEETS